MPRTLPPGVMLAALTLLCACQTNSPVQPTPPAACSFVLSPQALTFGASASSASVTVTTTVNCAWTSASDRGWLTIDSGANGTGSGAVKVTVSTNTGTSARAGTLTVAGQMVAVTQEAASAPACAVSLSPASATFSKDAATGTFTVSAPDACAWRASTTDAWVTVASGADGTGNGVVGYAISRNASVEARTGEVHVAGVVFSIVQQGDKPGVICDFHVAPVTLNVCMSAPSELATVITTQPSCGWTVSSDTPWIAISGAFSRTGPGEVRFRITDNYEAPRLGILKIRWETPTAGQNVQIAQAGCRYALSTASTGVPAAGGSFTFDVYQQSDPLECGGPLQNGCVWSAVAEASWITITSAMPRSGDDRVTFRVTANSGVPRAARITVRDTFIVVSQEGR